MTKATECLAFIIASKTECAEKDNEGLACLCLCLSVPWSKKLWAKVNLPLHFRAWNIHLTLCPA